MNRKSSQFAIMAASLFFLVKPVVAGDVVTFTALRPQAKAPSSVGSSLTVLFSKIANQEQVEAAFKTAQDEILHNSDFHGVERRLRETEIIQTLIELRQELVLHPRALPALLEDTLVTLDTLLGIALNHAREATELRDQVILELETEILNVLEVRTLQELSNSPRAQGERLAIPALNILVKVYCPTSLEVLHRIRLNAQYKMRDPLTEMKFVYKLAWAETLLAKRIGYKHIEAFLQQILFTEEALPYSHDPERDEWQGMIGHDLIESIYIDYIAATARAYSLIDRHPSSAIRLLVKIRDESPHLQVRQLADAAIAMRKTELVNTPDNPFANVPILPSPREPYPDLRSSPSIKVILNLSQQSEVFELQGNETTQRLRQFDWPNITLQLERMGIRHLSWLSEYQSDPTRNQFFTVAPGSNTHQFIVKDLMIRAELRELPRALIESAPNLWLAPIDERTEYMLKRVLQTDDVAVDGPKWRGLIGVPAHSQARLVMYQALAEFNQAHPHYVGPAIDDLDEPLVHGEVLDHIRQLYNKKFLTLDRPAGDIVHINFPKGPVNNERVCENLFQDQPQD